MRYTVVWKPEADDELADLWLKSLNQRAFTGAANAIDPALRNDPAIKGEWIDEHTKELYIYPIRVLFEVDDQDRQVRVLKVRLDASAG
jgi:hypothetical protein